MPVNPNSEPPTSNKDSPEAKAARYKEIIDSLPANPNDLLKQGWIETTHPNALKNGHRMFENKELGLIIQFDIAKPGAPGFKGINHYHVFNPSSTSDLDLYLDKNGNPVAKKSKASHIIK